MKTLITVLLCVLLSQVAPIRLNAEPPPKDTVVLVAFIVAICAVGVYAVVHIYGKYEEQTGPVTCVLLKSYSHGAGTWSPVATNTVILNGRNPIEVFRDRMTDPTAFYKVQIVN
jgi:hypothetical protein